LAREALCQQGTLIVMVPNAIPLFVRTGIMLGKTLRWLHYPSEDTERTGHIRFYTIESMTRLLSEEGFDIHEVRGVSFRMNGHFWARVCFWTAKLFMKGKAGVPARIDAWLGKKMPSLSPGLLFVCHTR
jgi:hypothetical protein